MKKKVLLVLVLCIAFSGVVYAASYRLISDKINPPQFYIFDNVNSLDAPIIDIAKSNAAYEWNVAVSQVQMNHTTNSSLNPKAEIQIFDDPYGSYWGMTGPATDGMFYVLINKGKIENEANGDVNIEKKYAKFVIIHEYGHLLGLDDLKLFDTRDSIMSYYANKLNIQSPTTNDKNGVKASYGF